ncbi:S1/P1 nuclease [Pseudoalteromonas sp. MMG010]|uniref:S1/P1 nuclease n=1 Tax=Pseudoalteromonas sp. MMG010 TaxID=2822685 RepID=UPI001FFC7BCF|nr:S1/P1 nuclease [Pseudoalteromonas sp. MMG010]
MIYIALTVCLISCTFVSLKVSAWGQNGHRIVGEIAQSHLTDTTKAALVPYLNGASLAQISTWPDEMRSAPGQFWQKESSRWHYINTLPNTPFKLDHSHTESKESVTNILEGIYFTSNTLSDSKTTVDEKQFSLRFLVHLVGDSHQPFHAGRSADRGGNSIKVNFFKESTNLHRLWDTTLIENQNLSFTEFAAFINTTDAQEIANYLNSKPETWLEESRDLSSALYKSTSEDISYEYIYENTPIVKKRLKQAGVRLAGILNAIFDPQSVPLKDALALK